jgi:hypothetical protein
VIETTLTKYYGATNDGRLDEDMRGYPSGRRVPDRKRKVLRDTDRCRCLLICRTP